MKNTTKNSENRTSIDHLQTITSGLGDLINQEDSKDSNQEISAYLNEFIEEFKGLLTDIEKVIDRNEKITQKMEILDSWNSDDLFE